MNLTHPSRPSPNSAALSVLLFGSASADPAGTFVPTSVGDTQLVLGKEISLSILDAHLLDLSPTTLTQLDKSA